MKNTFGNAVAVTLYGESHGPAVGAILDGMAPGIPVDTAFLADQMALRRSIAALSTDRREADKVEILSGVYQGKTTGTPICLQIANTNTRSGDYSSLADIPRPGHADYTGRVKYHGFADPHGGGHFSGRLTAGLVAVGAIAISALRAKGIVIGTHIAACAGIADRAFENLSADLAALAGMPFAVLDTDAADAEEIPVVRLVTTA